MSFKSAQRFAAAFTAAAVLLSSASVLPLNVHAALAIPSPSRVWDKDGYTYSYWQQDNKGKEFHLIEDPDSFYCEWTDVENYYFRKGHSIEMGSDYDDYYMSYDVSVKTDAISEKPEGCSYVGAYGFMKTEQGDTELYVIENGYNFHIPETTRGYKELGSFEDNGTIYDMYFTQLVIDTPFAPYYLDQYFSVKRCNQMSAGKTYHLYGSIDLKKHFEQWERAGLELGTLDCLYFDTEAYRCNGDLSAHYCALSKVPDTEPQEKITIQKHFPVKKDGYYYEANSFTGCNYDICFDDKNGFDLTWDTDNGFSEFRKTRRFDDYLDINSVSSITAEYDIDYSDLEKGMTEFSIHGYIEDSENKGCHDEFFIPIGMVNYEYPDEFYSFSTEFDEGGKHYGIYKGCKYYQENLLGIYPENPYINMQFRSLEADRSDKEQAKKYRRGTIDIKKHLDAMNKDYYKKGSDAPLYISELSLVVGSMSSDGKAHINKFDINIGESLDTEPPIIERWSNGSKITDENFIFEPNENGGCSATWDFAGSKGIQKYQKSKKPFTHDAQMSVKYDFELNDENADSTWDVFIHALNEDDFTTYVIVENYSNSFVTDPSLNPPYSILKNAKILQTAELQVNGNTYDAYCTLDSFGDLGIGGFYYYRYYIIRRDNASSEMPVKISGEINITDFIQAIDKTELPSHTKVLSEIGFSFSTDSPKGSANINECLLSLNKPGSTVTGHDIKGDINDDGIIDIFDLISERKALVNANDGISENKASDIDGNGKTEINDLVLLSSFVLGKTSAFPS